MRIAYVTTSAIPSRAANSIQSMKVADALAGLGHNVRVWAPGGQRGRSWVEIAGHYGLRSEFEVTWLPEVRTFRRYLFSARAVWSAARWRADLVYTRALQAAALASLAGVSTILELHGPPTGRMGPILLRLALRGSGLRKLIPTTRALASMLERYSASSKAAELLVLPNGADVEMYASLGEPSELRAELGWPDRFTAGYTGHLYPGRGADLMFELAKRNPEIRFVWAGGTADRVEFWRAQAGKQGVSNLELLGFIDHDRLPAFQAACEVLLAPYGESIAGSGGGDSASYASPMKVVEYLASGRAILCTDLPVIREILNEGSAVLLPPDDLDAWHSGLTAVKADPDLRGRLAKAARETASGLDWRVRQERALAGLGVGA